MDNLDYLKLELERSLLLLDSDAAEAIIKKSMMAGDTYSVTGDLISATLGHIGDLWEKGNLSLSQVYMSGMICEKIIENTIPPHVVLKPGQPRMAIGVYEDYHMLGKRIIYAVLKASGYELIDLGGGLSDDDLIGVVNREKIEVLLLSVLMLPSALHIRNLKNKLGNSGLKLVVGGAPFRIDSELWKEVGADFCGKDAAEALEIITKISGNS
ncbi:MAG: cobalamin-dependent protein [Bacteroidales bacterium]|nr:cobalamin-dependent protein [Bacteroidales bacterium]